LSQSWTVWQTGLASVKPETVLAWHRQGFRLYWTWKSRRRGGRPTVGNEIRALIRTMSEANPLWGAPRIHGELLKLGFRVSQATVAKYMVRRHTCAPQLLSGGPSYSRGVRLDTVLMMEPAQNRRRDDPMPPRELVTVRRLHSIRRRIQKPRSQAAVWAAAIVMRDP
jgi:hypothetical protein